MTDACCSAGEASSHAWASGQVHLHARPSAHITLYTCSHAVPAGYLECQESTAQGAAREALEEANCAVEILAPYTHFDVVTINQAYIIFRARATSPEAACAGDETLEVKWVNPHEICFDELAFSSISLALRLYVEDLEAGRFRVHYGVIDKTPGAGPNQPGTFVLQQHMALAVARER